MKTATKSRKSAGMPTIRPRVKLWLDIGGNRAFCPGICQILQEIDRTGSIKEAALAIDRSYRFVWGRLKEVESTLGQPLVETRVGGSQEKRSVLTELGKVLVEQFVEMRRQLFELTDGEFTRQINRALPKSSRR